jgi:uncharacterized membrane protein
MNENARLEAFTDGVLAIAITLLTLDLKVPPHGPGRPLSEVLLHQWPAYLAYLVSFLVIGIIWVNHHAMFRLIERVDRKLLFLNLMLLLVVAAIPFPTALLAEYLNAGRDSHTAAAVYSGAMLAMALAFLAMWWYAAHRAHLLHSQIDQTQARAATRRFGAGPLIYLATVGLSFVNATATLVTHLVIALYYCFDQLAVREQDG